VLAWSQPRFRAIASSHGTSDLRRGSAAGLAGHQPRTGSDAYSTLGSRSWIARRARQQSKLGIGNSIGRRPMSEGWPGSRYGDAAPSASLRSAAPPLPWGSNSPSLPRDSGGTTIGLLRGLLGLEAQPLRCRPLGGTASCRWPRP
jgi:hypothetical protein